MSNTYIPEERVAVVILHGIGEQKPMETLRGFVKGITSWIKKFQSVEKPRYWSRPDGISELYETRMITMERHDENPKMDFYEFYYAHHMRNTSFQHLLPWVWKLLTDPISHVPQRLKKLRRFVWVMIIISLALMIGLVVLFSLKGKALKSLPFIAAVMIVVPFLSKFFMWLFKGPVSSLLLTTAGDAARYFTPMPSNIEERSNIRREGIDFLKKLHQRKEKPYSKIVVVGHSLGSVVAYDMLRLLWNEMHEQFEPMPNVDHRVFDEMDKIALMKDSEAQKTMTVDQFQDLQQRCWQQYRANGNPWLITDFITCGAAITHANFYLLDKPSFHDRTTYKEFPVCPPRMEGSDTSLRFGEKKYVIKNSNGEEVENTVEFLNHASNFAVTRWTNIYFSSDFVGSEANTCFRWGVKDVKINREGLFFVPGGHTNYWDTDEGNEALSHIARAIGLRQCKEAE